MPEATPDTNQSKARFVVGELGGNVERKGCDSLGKRILEESTAPNAISTCRFAVSAPGAQCIITSCSTAVEGRVSFAMVN